MSECPQQIGKLFSLLKNALTKLISKEGRMALRLLSNRYLSVRKKARPAKYEQERAQRQPKRGDA
jgi:hypothetical protein